VSLINGLSLMICDIRVDVDLVADVILTMWIQLLCVACRMIVILPGTNAAVLCALLK
jgi:hypothetical protein